MRTALTVLVAFGLLAAVSAMVLVRVLVRPQTTSAAPQSNEVTLLIATKALPAMTIVDGTAVTARVVKKEEAPPGALSNAVQVVGKVLTRPMAEGEVFVKSSFSTEHKGVFFAATITEGKRAVTIALQDHNGMAGILYPGCVVDVLVTLLGPGNNAKEAISTTVLQGLQVIGIGSQTVAAEEFKDKNPGALSKGGGQVNHRNVTLLVTPKQAELLQLATKFGSVSLAMRNPTDTKSTPQQITRMAEFIGGADQMGTNILKAFAAMLRANPATPQTAVAAAPAKASEDTSEKDANPLWEILILRGTAQEKRTFPIEEADLQSDGAS